MKNWLAAENSGIADNGSQLGHGINFTAHLLAPVPSLSKILRYCHGPSDLPKLISQAQSSRTSRNSFDDHRLQDFLVHVCKLLDIDAALASGVLAEFW